MAQLIGIGAMPIITRLYTPHDFALSNIFLQTVSFMTIIITWRYEHFIQLPKDDRESDALLSLVIFLGAIGCLIATPATYFFKDMLAAWLNNIDMAKWIYFAPITAATMSFALAFQYRIQREQNYRKSGLAEIINKSGYVSSCFVGYWFLLGSVGLIFATAIGSLVKLIFLVISRRTKEHKLNEATPYNLANTLSKIKSLAKKYWRRSFSLVCSHIMLAVTGGIPVFFIAKTFGNEVLGQYSLVISTLYLPTSLIGNAIGQVYYQRAASRFSQGNNFVDIWRSTAKRLVFVGIPLYLAVMLISPWAYPIVFGQAWQDAGHYAAILSIAGFFSFITTPLDRACLVVNAWRYVLFWHSVRALSTGLVTWAAILNHWGFYNYLEMLVAQMSIMYLLDFFAEWRFSTYRKKG